MPPRLGAATVARAQAAPRGGAALPEAALRGWAGGRSRVAGGRSRVAGGRTARRPR